MTNRYARAADVDGDGRSPTDPATSTIKFQQTTATAHSILAMLSVHPRKRSDIIVGRVRSLSDLDCDLIGNIVMFATGKHGEHLVRQVLGWKVDMSRRLHASAILIHGSSLKASLCLEFMRALDELSAERGTIYDLGTASKQHQRWACKIADAVERLRSVDVVLDSPQGRRWVTSMVSSKDHTLTFRVEGMLAALVLNPDRAMDVVDEWIKTGTLHGVRPPGLQ